MSSERKLVSSSVSIAGVKVPAQMDLLSLAWFEIIVLSVPLRLVMSALEKSVPLVCDNEHPLEAPQTGSENSSVTVALSPIFNSVSDIVKLSTAGGMVSTLTLELSGTVSCVRLSEVAMLPAASLIVMISE